MNSSRSHAIATFGAGAAIVLGALAAYQGALSGPFVFLDVPSIVDNPSIRHLWTIGRVLSPPSDGGLTVGGRPLVNLSLAVNYALGGLSPFGYRVFNLAIHVLAGWTLFGIVRRTLERMWAASAGPFLVAAPAALIWTMHPLQTESVTYVIQRAESLMGLLYLLTLYCFIRAATEQSARRRFWHWFGLSWLACLFGMGTKEVMVSAPVMVFLYDATFVSPGWRSAIRARPFYYAMLAATWIPLALLVVSTRGRGGTSGFELNVTWGSYLLTQFPAVVRYIRLAAWPYPLNFYYPVHWPQAAEVAPQMIGVLALFLAAAAALWRRRPWGFLGFWFFAILAPTSLVPGISQTVAEHRMYLALAPLAVAAAAGLWVLCRRLGRPGVAACVAAGAMAAGALCVATGLRNRVYRSELALWSDTAAKSPDNPYVQVNAGVAAAGAGRRVEAIAYFERALALNPRYAEAHNNLGLALAQSGLLDKAMGRYREALRLKPDYPDAEANLGAALAQSGNLGEAAGHLRRAVQLDAGNLNARNNLAAVLAESGRLDEAIAEYGTVLRADPDSAETRFNLGNALCAERRWGEAVDQFRQALRTRETDSDLHANLGAALANLGRLDEAIAEYRRALELAPSDADVHRNLDMALRSLGREPEAGGRVPPGS